ncbi:DNA polymerase epsilon catalytic subunit A [Nosema bombycis CQ1]|uniref:DNA polymerase epsilon catalytic subunit n=1 Tax=Nosema bombycis (strain CQ1 / CVCC 102059) TaxID=578461 RepID=R0KN68_NOSB1|nr:DNA polymerase epsilon catalytic subunit A [Nosema bombycis CQ1]|eukprot:EOB12106.1 DNA polymerase epsilon catalytic subunit A [Nosema bombycis CQ1]
MTVELLNLEEQFLYMPYYDKEKREGWIHNIKILEEETTASHIRIYFIDKSNNNFVIKMPLYYTFLIEGEFLSDIEEYLKRTYSSGYHSSKIVKKIDTKEFNHLSGNGKEFLYVEIKYRSVFNIIIRDLKKIIRLNNTRKQIDLTLKEMTKNQEINNIKDHIIQIHEYDIGDLISAMNRLNIRCGKWYKISYNGESYNFESTNSTNMPNLRVFTYDIETTKKPLQFPDSECDEIMMISIKTEKGNELIVNRNVVGKDIDRFNYSPMPEYESFFEVSNEIDEKSLIVRFIETLQEHKPHIITSYNGSSFDFPYLEKRANFYNLSFTELLV